MSKDITIEIKTNPKFKLSTMLLTVFSQVGVIGAGVLVDSPAMQWCGFGLLCLSFLGGVARNIDQNTGMSLKEARQRLDSIEARERKL